MKKRLKKLSDMRNGESGIIRGINGGRGLHNRLEILGIMIGTKIFKKSSIFKIGPTIINVGMTEVAIGHHMAQKINVEVEVEE